MTTTVGALDLVLDALTPYWAAEAEVCRAHLGAKDRDPATDARWLSRQAAKELHDGVVPRLERLREAVMGSAPATLLAREARELHEEAAHHDAFVVAHDAVATEAGLPTIAELDLAHEVSWVTNAALAELRSEHVAVHGRAGELATVLTEGGCAALFAVGAELGGTPIDDAIATACRAVLTDEVAHLRSGLDDLAVELEQVDVGLVVSLAVAQSRQRLRMRQEQLWDPVAADRLAELLTGMASTEDVAAVGRRLGRDRG